MHNPHPSHRPARCARAARPGTGSPEGLLAGSILRSGKVRRDEQVRNEQWVSMMKGKPNRNRRRANGHDAATQLTELAVAAGQTIAHRSGMLARAAGDAVALADPEFVLMGHEKLAVAVETGHAAAAAFLEGQRMWSDWMMRQAWTMMEAGLAMATSCTPGAALAAQLRCANRSLVNAESAGAGLVSAVSDAASRLLHPAHRVASANARRLGRGR